MNIFNIHIEFDSKIFCKTVEDYIAKKPKGIRLCGGRECNHHRTEGLEVS